VRSTRLEEGHLFALGHRSRLEKPPRFLGAVEEKAKKRMAETGMKPAGSNNTISNPPW
jgi:hypothetical protein